MALSATMQADTLTQYPMRLSPLEKLLPVLLLLARLFVDGGEDHVSGVTEGPATSNWVSSEISVWGCTRFH